MTDPRTDAEKPRKSIPLVDLQAQLEMLSDEIDQAMSQVLSRCDFILGSAVADFEQAFASFCGVEHAVGIASGLEALRLSLQASNIGMGDEVIIPANTFIATAFAVAAIGATPVLVDVNGETHNIDVTQIEAAITSRTRAMIPVHLFGQPCDLAAVTDIARRHNLLMIEDAAQAHGAAIGDQRVGSLSDAGCFSFFPAKNLGAAGDGGMITTNSEELATCVRQLRHYGQETKYRHTVLGTNSRLDTLQAAILNVKLPRLTGWNQARRQHAEQYRQLLSGIGDIRFPKVIDGVTPVYHLFVIETKARDALMAFLTKRGIQTGIHYPTPIHLQPAFAYLKHLRGCFPTTERLAKRILSLPMFPELSAEQIEHVASSVQEFFATRQRQNG
jgi:dTDP-4-amino-4,6-dideoxygalactose transaminase